MFLGNRGKQFQSRLGMSEKENKRRRKKVISQWKSMRAGGLMEDRREDISKFLFFSERERDACFQQCVDGDFFCHGCLLGCVVEEAVSVSGQKNVSEHCHHIYLGSMDPSSPWI